MRWALLFAFLFAPSLRADEPIQVFFGPRSADDQTGLYYNLLRFINSADESLYAAVHEIDMITVAEFLARRSKAGVDVQLVVEGEWWTNSKNKAARQVLEKAGVKVTPDTKKSGLMHNKFFIADKKRVWTGSTNITETCLLFNPNNSLWIESEPFAENYLAMFKLYQEGKFGKRATMDHVNPHDVVEVGKTKIYTYFSPKDEPLEAIIQRINDAKISVDMMSFVFSSRDIGKALETAHARGVKVRILLDNQFSHAGLTRRWPYVPFNELKKLGMMCKYDDEDSKLHHKVILIDGDITITGSFNFSTSAVKDNDENLIILESAAINKRYRTEFEKLWNYYSGDPGTPPKLEGGDDK